MFRLPRLPYDYHALEPVISARTLRAHHDHHHRAYVENLNREVRGTRYERMTVEQILRRGKSLRSCKKGVAIFDNAGQHYNHSFYWRSLSPARTYPTADLEKEIIGNLKGDFLKVGMSVFGSGWMWLASTKSGLVWDTTPNGMATLAYKSLRPLLVVDVWEHAYYLDYAYDRIAYLRGVWELLNWDFASDNLASPFSIPAG